MFTNVASVSLLALSSIALTSAAPAPQRGGKYTWGAGSWGSGGGSGGKGSGNGNGGGSGQSAPPASTSDTVFPLSNGFPNITNPSSQLTAIELAAMGTLSNAPPPATVSADTLTSLEFVAFNELTEVAFFTELLFNITNNVPGYSIAGDGVEQFVVNALVAVQAQEELHALNANGALKHFGAQPILPCEYSFPVTTFAEAIALAATFTDVTLGTLQDVQSKLATDGDAGLIKGIGSVIGQEGEQNGYYRTLLNKIPSALPFLTTSTREFAFSALNQNFVVKGSCPNLNEIKLPIFGPLTVVTPNIQPVTQNLQFSIDLNDVSGAGSYSGFSVVYINQQNLPVVEPLLSPTQSGSVVSFSAAFPYGQFEMNGLTLAAVVRGSGPFASANDVAAAALFGPGLIEIN